MQMGFVLTAQARSASWSTALHWSWLSLLPLSCGHGKDARQGCCADGLLLEHNTRDTKFRRCFLRSQHSQRRCQLDGLEEILSEKTIIHDPALLIEECSNIVMKDKLWNDKLGDGTWTKMQYDSEFNFVAIVYVLSLLCGNWGTMKRNTDAEPLTSTVIHFLWFSSGLINF